MCMEDILCLLYSNRWSPVQRELTASFFVAFVFGILPLALVILFNDEENLREEHNGGSSSSSTSTSRQRSRSGGLSRDTQNTQRYRAQESGKSFVDRLDEQEQNEIRPVDSSEQFGKLEFSGTHINTNSKIRISIAKLNLHEISSGEDTHSESEQENHPPTSASASNSDVLGISKGKDGQNSQTPSSQTHPQSKTIPQASSLLGVSFDKRKANNRKTASKISWSDLRQEIQESDIPEDEGSVNFSNSSPPLGPDFHERLEIKTKALTSTTIKYEAGGRSGAKFRQHLEKKVTFAQRAAFPYTSPEGSGQTKTDNDCGNLSLAHSADEDPAKNFSESEVSAQKQNTRPKDVGHQLLPGKTKNGHDLGENVTKKTDASVSLIDTEALNFETHERHTTQNELVVSDRVQETSEIYSSRLNEYSKEESKHLPIDSEDQELLGNRKKPADIKIHPQHHSDSTTIRKTREDSQGQKFGQTNSPISLRQRSFINSRRNLTKDECLREPLHNSGNFYMGIHSDSSVIKLIQVEDLQKARLAPRRRENYFQRTRNTPLIREENLSRVGHIPLTHEKALHKIPASLSHHLRRSNITGSDSGVLNGEYSPLRPLGVISKDESKTGIAQYEDGSASSNISNTADKGPEIEESDSRSSHGVAPETVCSSRIDLSPEEGEAPTHFLTQGNDKSSSTLGRDGEISKPQTPSGNLESHFPRSAFSGMIEKSPTTGSLQYDVLMQQSREQITDSIATVTERYLIEEKCSTQKKPRRSLPSTESESRSRTTRSNKEPPRTLKEGKGNNAGKLGPKDGQHNVSLLSILCEELGQEQLSETSTIEKHRLEHRSESNFPSATYRESSQNTLEKIPDLFEQLNTSKTSNVTASEGDTEHRSRSSLNVAHPITYCNQTEAGGNQLSVIEKVKNESVPSILEREQECEVGKVSNSARDAGVQNAQRFSEHHLSRNMSSVNHGQQPSLTENSNKLKKYLNHPGDTVHCDSSLKNVKEIYKVDRGTDPCFKEDTAKRVQHFPNPFANGSDDLPKSNIRFRSTKSSLNPFVTLPISPPYETRNSVQPELNPHLNEAKRLGSSNPFLPKQSDLASQVESHTGEKDTEATYKDLEASSLANAENKVRPIQKFRLDHKCHDGVEDVSVKSRKLIQLQKKQLRRLFNNDSEYLGKAKNGLPTTLGSNDRCVLEDKPLINHGDLGKAQINALASSRTGSEISIGVFEEEEDVIEDIVVSIPPIIEERKGEEGGVVVTVKEAKNDAGKQVEAEVVKDEDEDEAEYNIGEDELTRQAGKRVNEFSSVTTLTPDEEEGAEEQEEEEEEEQEEEEEAECEDFEDGVELFESSALYWTSGQRRRDSHRPGIELSESEIPVAKAEPVLHSSATDISDRRSESSSNWDWSSEVTCNSNTVLEACTQPLSRAGADTIGSIRGIAFPTIGSYSDTPKQLSNHSSDDYLKTETTTKNASGNLDEDQKDIVNDTSVNNASKNSNKVIPLSYETRNKHSVLTGTKLRLVGIQVSDTSVQNSYIFTPTTPIKSQDGSNRNRHNISLSSSSDEEYEKRQARLCTWSDIAKHQH